MRDDYKKMGAWVVYDKMDEHTIQNEGIRKGLGVSYIDD